MIFASLFLRKILEEEKRDVIDLLFLKKS